MKRAYGATTELIITKLEDYGPMTRAELCQTLGLSHDYVSAVISRLVRQTLTMPKRVHISGYVYDADGLKRYPRAVFSVGDKPDAKRPRADKLANRRRYEQSKRTRLSGASVFTWGLTRKELQNHIKAVRQKAAA